MKQLLFCDHSLTLKKIVLTNATVNNFDCVSPQKTTLEIPLSMEIENSDLVIIKDQNTMQSEYIGIIDTVQNDKTTVLLVYPFINIFDNECMLSQLDGDVFTWIEKSINDNFVDTGDELNDFPIVVRNYLTTDVDYKQIIESNNMLDNTNDIFLNTGIYVEFSIGYTGGKPTTIYADVRNANEQTVFKIRYDNPIIVDGNVTIESSHTGSYNKAIIQIVEEENGEKTVLDTEYIYLRDDNKLTSNPLDEKRIKQVKPKIIEYTPEENLTTAEMGEALILLAQKALCGDSFDHSIEFVSIRNEFYDWKINRRCDFIAKDRMYETYVTKVEYLSDKHVKVVLGAYRYSLTDRFKELRKGDATANELKGIEVSNAFGEEMYWFTQENGNLVLNYKTDAPDYSLDENGNLCIEYDDSTQEQPNLSIDGNGELNYNLHS